MEQNKEEIGGFLNQNDADNLSRSIEDLFVDRDENGNEIVGSKVDGYNDTLINFELRKNDSTKIKQNLEKQIKDMEELLSSLPDDSEKKTSVESFLNKMRTMHRSLK